MNCIEFRRQHDIDPRCRDEPFMLHKRDCASCADFAARAAKLEYKLDAALRVPLPENLASRILLKQSFHAAGRWSRVSRIGLGVAASVLLSVVVGISIWVSRDGPTLDREVVRLIDEAEHALVPVVPVALQQIRASLKPVGIDLTREIGVVTFASPCVVRGKLAGHLVLRGEKAPISILMMPNESLAERLDVDERDSVGVVVPSGRGAIAIVGARGEPLEAIENLLRNAVRWSV